MTTVKVKDLRGFHRNPRRGRVDLIEDSLRTYGQYRSIVVNAGTKTGRRNEVLVGNHTWQAAKQAGLDTVEAKIVDVDEETATKIVLADNRTADSGGYDDTILLDLLSGLDTIEHTGYSEDDLDDLLIALEPVGDYGQDENDLDRFAATSMRAMYVEYSADEFIQAQETLARIANTRHLDSNAAVIQILAAEAVRGTT